MYELNSYCQENCLTKYISQDLVLLLVERNADVNVRNGEGRTAREVGAEGGDTKKLLAAAERTDLRRKEEAFLSAARNGQLDVISNMVSFCISLCKTAIFNIEYYLLVCCDCS